MAATINTLGDDCSWEVNSHGYNGSGAVLDKKQQQTNNNNKKEKKKRKKQQQQQKKNKDAKRK